MSSISRLPDSTARLISAHVVVVTPVLLIKELLDNAIDAKATSVEIIVSHDTISRIELRDDGTGIHPDDYDALGRRGHTSKLRTLEELGNAFGKTLGFRGEALASINSMSDVTITTKIAAEPVAAVLQLVPEEGGILTHKSTSAPVGTTICVRKLFGRQPVREQMAIKEAKKTLDRIQELLRSYAMARPNLKILFKILQTPTKIWSYSPQRNATPLEAVLQLFGTEAASNCLLKISQTNQASEDGDPPAKGRLSRPLDNYGLEAILSKPNADFQKVPKGHYFCVDGRPISATRGVVKRLLAIYVEHLRGCIGMKNAGDCFIRLNICCPPGSYDANIEPSKDDVLFSDEQVVLAGFKRLCNEIYEPGVGNLDGRGQSHRIPELQAAPCVSNCNLRIMNDTPKSSHGASHDTLKQSIDTERLAERPTDDQAPHEACISTTFKPVNPKSFPASPQLKGLGNNHNAASSSLNQCNVDMSIDFNERPRRRHEGRSRVEPASFSTLKPRVAGEGLDGNHPSPLLNVETAGLSRVLPSNSDSNLNCPPVSPSIPELPILRHVMAPPGDLDVPRNYKGARRAKRHCHQSLTVPGGPYRSPVSSPSERRLEEIPDVTPDNSRITLRRQRREQPPWTPPSPGKRNRVTNASQINEAHSEDRDGFKQTRISFNGNRGNRRRIGTQENVTQSQSRFEKPPNGAIDGNPCNNMHDVFSTARKHLDYQLSQMQGDQLSSVNPDEGPQHRQQSPRRRQPFNALETNTFRGGQTPQDNREPIATTLPTGDPRAYLLRRQKSMAGADTAARLQKLKRQRSSLMPLENTPPECQIHALSWTTSISSPVLNEIVNHMRGYDNYVIYGGLVEGLDMSLADGRAVEAQLQKLLTGYKENIDSRPAGDGQVIVDLQTALKGKNVMPATAT
ncbi:hypothetical protein F4777DRAFT_237022 [Nemania sp. FL0916]|nr:hypothetical protein F4777DRAFT_237022 [Nemania sp. FL0916]